MILEDKSEVDCILNLAGASPWDHYNSPGASCAAGSRGCTGPRTWPRGSFTIIIAQQGVLD